MKRIKLSALLISTLFFYHSINAQEVIYLKNPSFEDEARHSSTPIGWDDLGFMGESPPDTHPSGDFGVQMPALHGNTYLGMVVRDNDTWERVGQRLDQRLKAGVCYQLELAVARSGTFTSYSQLKKREASYTTPCKLRIYAGEDKQMDQLLAETTLIEEESWEYRLLEFTPDKNYGYLTIEVFYDEPVLFPYNGNVLIDNLSPVVPCSLLEDGSLPGDFDKSSKN